MDTDGAAGYAQVGAQATAWDMAGDSSYYKQQIIVSYVILLAGRHRLARVQLLFNRLKGRSVAGAGWRQKGKADSGATCILQDMLRRKFGADAVGVLADGVAYYDENDMINAGAMRNGHKYYVLYEEAAPSYSGPSAGAGVSTAGAFDLPDYAADEGVRPAAAPLQGADVAEAANTDYAAPPEEPFVADRVGRHVHRVHGLSYYSNLPLFSKRLNLRFAGDRVKTVVITNKDTRHIDTLLNFMSREGGTDRWVGVRVKSSARPGDGGNGGAVAKHGTDTLGMARPAVNYTVGAEESLRIRRSSTRRSTFNSDANGLAAAVEGVKLDATTAGDSPASDDANSDRELERQQSRKGSLLSKFRRNSSAKANGKERASVAEPPTAAAAAPMTEQNGEQVVYKEYLDDTILFDDDVVEDGIYDVTYRPPGKTDLVGKARDKSRGAIYTQVEGF